jgi:hypothetical protein
MVHLHHSNNLAAHRHTNSNSCLQDQEHTNDSSNSILRHHHHPLDRQCITKAVRHHPIISSNVHRMVIQNDHLTAKTVHHNRDSNPMAVVETGIETETVTHVIVINGAVWIFGGARNRLKMDNKT